eukprot:TRINITY_DN675_c0_g1_i1.p1 TRINITY_DN675_c0_g1~~TRINITY_DN675_c0_g1_i1.p1  ORF type:complete len:453 (+),score=66.66 TRINITY_DN675_c0_g1_i1:43-1401(+)
MILGMRYMQCARASLALPFLLLVLCFVTAPLVKAEHRIDASTTSRDAAVGDGREQDRRTSVEVDAEADMRAIGAEVLALDALAVDAEVMALEADLTNGERSWGDIHAFGMERFACSVSRSASSESRADGGAGGGSGAGSGGEGGTHVLDLAAPRVLLAKYCSMTNHVADILSMLVRALCIPLSNECAYEALNTPDLEGTQLRLGLNRLSGIPTTIAACALSSRYQKAMMVWKDGKVFQTTLKGKDVPSRAPAYLKAGTRFFVMWRASLLDRFLCVVRDCFLWITTQPEPANATAYVVAPGSDAELRDYECFQRRKSVDSHAHVIYVRSPEKMAAVFDAWLKEPKGWLRRFGKLGVNASALPVVVTSESLILFESDPSLLDAAVTEWHNVLSSLDIYADLRDVRAFLAPMAGTREPPKSFAEQIRNWDEVETYLKTQRPDLYDIVMRRGRPVG